MGDHLVGNVYVKFDDEEDAEKAYTALNGRYYAGRSLQVCLNHPAELLNNATYPPLYAYTTTQCGILHTPIAIHHTTTATTTFTTTSKTPLYHATPCVLLILAQDKEHTPYTIHHTSYRWSIPP
ncbi:hypothetical protein EON63_03985 [archaeon]|nr:MAG: hypothetical protein EON63_03985 [archaeon]